LCTALFARNVLTPFRQCDCTYADDRVAKWHLVISGFTQHRGDPTGSQRLWMELRAAVGREPNTAVEFFCWNADWNAVAEWIWRCGPAGEPPVVFVYAYSWGAGWGFVQLARELRKRGIDVRWAVLCDPVYRHPLLPWLFFWLSISRLFRPRIVAPPNVDHVWYCVQRLDRWPQPRGHQVIAAVPRATYVLGPLLLERTHHYMDDAPEWHERALETARYGSAVAPLKIVRDGSDE
jgi:hypothetical protein